MEIIDYANKLRETIPLTQDTDKSYIVFLKEHLKGVCKQLENINKDELEKVAATFAWSRDQLIHNFDYLTNMLIKSLQRFYNEKPDLAYNYFKKKVLAVKLDGTTRYIDFFRLHGTIAQSFYRIGEVENDNRYDSEDGLYHVPFHLRAQIAPQRFSIAEYPILYLSNSIETCWLEKDCIEEFFMSEYTLNNAIALVDISVPNEFEKVLQDLKPLFLFLITYPLIVASSIKVKDRDLPFKPEYVIPQFILQFIRNEKEIDGVMYTSTKIPNNKNNETWSYKNIAIPVLSNKDSGYCEKLRKKFNITMPKFMTANELSL